MRKLNLEIPDTPPPIFHKNRQIIVNHPKCDNEFMKFVLNDIVVNQEEKLECEFHLQKLRNLNRNAELTESVVKKNLGKTTHNNDIVKLIEISSCLKEMREKMN